MLRTRLLWILATVLLTLGVRQAFSDEKDAPEVEPPSAEQMARMMAAAAPGPEHAVLARLVGTWEADVRVWMDPTTTEPMVEKLTATNAMILGGRFLQMKASGTSAVFGDVETLTLMGCDRRDGTWTSVGFDTMGTYFVAARGHYDAETGRIELKGTDKDPIFGVLQVFRSVTTIVSEDEYVHELFMSDRLHTRGLVPEHRMLEIRHKRVKAAGAR